MHDKENPIPMPPQKIRESIIALARLQHIDGKITDTTRHAPGFNRHGLAPVLPLESEALMLVDVGKTELRPAVHRMVQRLHHPDDTVDPLIEFRKLCEATGAHDG